MTAYALQKQYTESASAAAVCHFAAVASRARPPPGAVEKPSYLPCNQRVDPPVLSPVGLPNPKLYKDDHPLWQDVNFPLPPLDLARGLAHLESLRARMVTQAAASAAAADEASKFAAATLPPPRPSLLSPPPAAGVASPRGESWSAEEDQLIINAMLARHKRKAAGQSVTGYVKEAYEVISRATGRTPNAINNRWHSKVKNEFKVKHAVRLTRRESALVASLLTPPRAQELVDLDEKE